MTNKKQIIKVLETECHDFLNCRVEGIPMPGYPDERIKGFYIDIEDVADIIKRKFIDENFEQIVCDSSREELDVLHERILKEIRLADTAKEEGYD